MQLRTILTLVLLAVATTTGLACSSVEAVHRDVFRHDGIRQNSDPISGDWDVTFHVQNQTTPATFSLKLEGEKVTGTAYSHHTGAGTVRDGSWTNDRLSFTLDFKNHESIAVTGTLKDGALSGEFTTEGFTEKWNAKKK
jgi:hypothetical protein